MLLKFKKTRGFFRKISEKLPHIFYLLAAGVIAMFIFRRFSDHNLAFSLAASFFSYTLFAALPMAYIALKTKSKAMFLVLLVVVASLVIIIKPQQALHGCGDVAPSGEVTIFSANVYFKNQKNASEVLDSALENNAQIIALQETTHQFIDALEADERLDEYKYRLALPLVTSKGQALYSKFKLDDLKLDKVGKLEMISATVNPSAGETASTSFKIHVIHTNAPTRLGYFGDWKNELNQLSEIGSDEPKVMIGDFNASRHHQSFRKILDNGWTDALDTNSCGVQTTFPSFGPIPGLLRIDHMLVTDDIEVHTIETGADVSSDHKPLIAKFSVAEE